MKEIASDAKDAQEMECKLREMTSERWQSLIRESAYRHWDKAGRPHGQSDEFWRLAELEMQGARLLVLEQLRTLYWKYKHNDLLEKLQSYCVEEFPSGKVTGSFNTLNLPEAVFAVDSSGRNLVSFQVCHDGPPVVEIRYINTDGSVQVEHL